MDAVSPGSRTETCESLQIKFPTSFRIVKILNWEFFSAGIEQKLNHLDTNSLDFVGFILLVLFGSTKNI